MGTLWARASYQVEEQKEQIKLMVMPVEQGAMICLFEAWQWLPSCN